MKNDSAKQPIWQPISALPMFLSLVEEQLADILQLQTVFTQCQDRPHLLDDAALDRVLTVYTQQQDLLPVQNEQLARWQAMSLTVGKQDQLRRYGEKLQAVSMALTEVLARARELKGRNINRLMAMSDTQLGEEILAGNIREPSSATDSSPQAKRQVELALGLDRAVRELRAAGCDHTQLLAKMHVRMQDFHELLHLAGEQRMGEFVAVLPNLRYYAILLSQLAQGIRDGNIAVPR